MLPRRTPPNARAAHRISDPPPPRLGIPRCTNAARRTGPGASRAHPLHTKTKRETRDGSPAHWIHQHRWARGSWRSESVPRAAVLSQMHCMFVV